MSTMRRLHVLHVKENNRILTAESTQGMIKGHDCSLINPK